MQRPMADFTRMPYLYSGRRRQMASRLGTANSCSKRLKPLAILIGILVAGTAQADSLSGAALVTTLRQGGYVLLMRHASSPPTPPTAASAEPNNTKLERQLDETGRSSARAMGEAIKTLSVPLERFGRARPIAHRRRSASPICQTHPWRLSWATVDEACRRSRRVKRSGCRRRSPRGRAPAPIRLL